MSAEFENFYKLIPDLDIDLEREENYERLRKAVAVWSKRAGRKAQEKERLIKDAMRIFSSQQAYEAYHRELAQHCKVWLKKMVDLALADDNVLSNSEASLIIDRAVSELSLSINKITAWLLEVLDEIGIEITNLDTSFQTSPTPVAKVAKLIDRGEQWVGTVIGKSLQLIGDKLAKTKWFNDFTGSYAVFLGLIGVAMSILIIGSVVGAVGGFFIFLGLATLYVATRRRRE